MKLFTRNKRLKSLEEYLGVFYVNDGEYAEHKVEDESYAAIGNIHRRLKKLEALAIIKGDKNNGRN